VLTPSDEQGKGLELGGPSTIKGEIETVQDTSTRPPQTFEQSKTTGGNDNDTDRKMVQS